MVDFPASHLSFQGGVLAPNPSGPSEPSTVFVTETRQSQSSRPTSIARKKIPPSSSTHCLTVKKQPIGGDILWTVSPRGALDFLGWGQYIFLDHPWFVTGGLWEKPGLYSNQIQLSLESQSVILAMTSQHPGDRKFQIRQFFRAWSS